MNASKFPRKGLLLWSLHLVLVTFGVFGLWWLAVHPDVIARRTAESQTGTYEFPKFILVPTLIAVGLMGLAPVRPLVGLILSIAIGYGFPRREHFDFFCRWHATEVLALLSVTTLLVGRRCFPEQTSEARPFLEIVRHPLGITIVGLMTWTATSAMVAYMGGEYRPVSNHNLSQMFTATCLWLVAASCLHSTANWYWLGIALGATLTLRTLAAPQYVHLEGDMGVLQSMSIPFTVAAIALGVSWRSKLVACTLLGVQICTVLYTENRGGLVALGVASFLGSLFCKRKWRLLLYACPILVAFGFAFSSSNFRERFEAIWRGGPDRNSVDSRFVIYEACWNMFLANPVFGVGLGNTEPRMAAYSSVGKSDSPHNIVMGMLAETGAIGAVLFVAFFIGTTAMAYWRAFRWPLGAPQWGACCLGSSLVAYQISGMFMTRHTLELAYLFAGGAIALEYWKLEADSQKTEKEAQ